MRKARRATRGYPASISQLVRKEASRFLKECLEWKVKDKIRPHCVPVFEVSYSPRQQDEFQKNG